MTKYSYEFKKKVVDAYLHGEGGYTFLAEKYGIKSNTRMESSVMMSSCINMNQICFCFRLDREQTDKISFLKFAELDDEKTIGDYNLSEENAGIYLPD